MTAQADALKTIRLTAGDARVDLLNFGATTCDWRVPTPHGVQPMILGFDDPKAYLTSPFFFGAIAGRVSNRIGGGQYMGPKGLVTLDQNEGTTTLHGGSKGLGSIFWALNQTSETEAMFTHLSPDGSCGFPGNVSFTVQVRLTETSLTYDLSAQSDQPTPVSLAQHNYYNIGAAQDIWSHHLHCQSSQMLAQDGLGVSTGEIVDLSDSAMDLRKGSRLGAFADRGLDDHFLFEDQSTELRHVATLKNEAGQGLKFYSDQLGAQIYTAHGMPQIEGGLDGETYGAASGVCFEPQGHPNAVNRPEFPSIMITPDRPYQQRLRIETISSGS